MNVGELKLEAAAAAAMAGALSNKIVALVTDVLALAARVNVVVPAPDEIVVTSAFCTAEAEGVLGIQNGTVKLSIIGEP